MCTYVHIFAYDICFLNLTELKKSDSWNQSKWIMTTFIEPIQKTKPKNKLM